MKGQFLASAIVVLVTAGTLCASTVSFPEGYVGDPTVIGDPNLFQINSATFNLTPTLITATFNFNYGTNTLANFTAPGVPPILSAADLLFRVGSTWKYGVSSTNHSNSPDSASVYSSGGSPVIPDDLYQINAGGVLTAQDVIAYQPTSSYYYNQPVWLWNAGTTITKLTDAPAPVSVQNTNSPATNLNVTFSFTPTAGFNSDLASGNLFFQFASATCSNDYTFGQFTAPVGTPEPLSLLLFGSGLVGLAAFGRLRRRRS